MDEAASCDNGILEKRVAALEKKVQLQEDDIVLLKAGLSEALRKLAVIDTAPSAGSKARHATVPPLPSSKSTTPRGSVNKQVSPASSPKVTSEVKKWPAFEAPTSGNSNAISRTKAKEKEITQKEPVEGCLKFYMRGRSLNFYAPSSFGSNFLANCPSQLPKEKLVLEWVYGYRGKDARSNIFFLPTGEIVYFIAAVAILYNIEEQTQRHYIGHTDDIRCLAVHPDKVTIATGQVAGHDKTEGKPSKKSDSQEKPMLQPHVRIWSSINLTTLKIIGLGDFERAVACVSFSKVDGGVYLAVVDEGNEHSLSVWDWQKGEKGTKISENKSSGDPVFFAEFHPCEPNSLVLCGKGQITFWTLDGSVLSKKAGIFDKHDKPKFVTCLAFAESGEVISGDSSGNICIWEKGSNKIHQAILGAHDGALFTLCTLKDGQLISGGKDRKMIKWEFADGVYKKMGQECELPLSYGPARHLCEGMGSVLIVGTTKNAILQGSIELNFAPIVQGHAEELWGLASHPSQNQFVTVGYDKVIYMWDSLAHRVVWQKEMAESCHAIAIHPTGQVVAVSGLSPRWYVMDISTHEVLSSYSDAAERIECLQFSPDGSLLACGSRDNSIYIYKCSPEKEYKFHKVTKLTGHTSFVLHVDWSRDGAHLRSNSGDYELLFWDVNSGRSILSPSSMRDVDWLTCNCTLSFEACGMWPEGSDGTDVNACTRSHKQNLLASADDFGKVSLFSYPCFQPKSRGLTYRGHSSHVTNVNFLCDDTRLISVGGKDASVMQWQLTDTSTAL